MQTYSGHIDNSAELAADVGAVHYLMCFCEHMFSVNALS